jgi:hypothetical protein
MERDADGSIDGLSDEDQTAVLQLSAYQGVDAFSRRPLLRQQPERKQPDWGRAEDRMVPNKNGAVTSAVLVHLRVEPAHFDWRWRERPALALLAWEALVRDPLARLRRIQVESIGTTIKF